MMTDAIRYASRKPQVSVLMSVYNAEAYVAEAIESILGQTLADFEFLIVDDGSTDGSAEIVASYAEKDPRISFRMQENRGVPITRNEMAAAARAPLRDRRRRCTWHRVRRARLAPCHRRSRR